MKAKLLLATYFGSVAEHADLLKALPVAGLHIDLVRAPEQLAAFVDYDKILSVGIIDGRNTVSYTHLHHHRRIFLQRKNQQNQLVWCSCQPFSNFLFILFR